jgi:hypothetical protein
MRAETTLIMEYSNQHSLKLCYYLQSKYSHYVISAKIKSETNTFNQMFIHCFVSFRPKIHIIRMMEDYTTKESFQVVVMLYTTILFTFKRMLISMVWCETAQSRNHSKLFQETSVQLFCLLRITNVCLSQDRRSYTWWIVQTKTSSAISVISV